jgi:hypothetical protein
VASQPTPVVAPIPPAAEGGKAEVELAEVEPPPGADANDPAEDLEGLRTPPVRELAVAPEPPSGPLAPETPLEGATEILANKPADDLDPLAEVPDPPAAEAQPQEVILLAMADLPPPRYLPPLGAPSGVRVMNSFRGLGAPIQLSVLAPDHVGRTLLLSPTLYWFIDRHVDRSATFTLLDESIPVLQRDREQKLDFHTQSGLPGHPKHHLRHDQGRSGSCP